jgi:hypothetical protein
MMVEMHRIDALQGQMVRDKIFIDYLTNPSVVVWNGHLVLATSLVWAIKEAPYFRPANRTPSETTEFALLNITTITSSTAYVGPIRDRNPWAPSNLNAKKLRQVQPLDDEYVHLFFPAIYYCLPACLPACLHLLTRHDTSLTHPPPSSIS